MNIIDYSAINEFIKTSKTESIQKAAINILREFGITAEIKGHVPRVGPVLLISNHPGGTDSFVILSSIKRNDFYSVVLASHKNFGDTLAQKVLPIYRKRKIRDTMLTFTKGFQVHILNDQNELQLRNRESISRAAQLISKKHMVAIYPTGTGGKMSKNGKWKAGVGFLTKQITNPNVQVIFAHIKGTEKIDLLRHIHPKLRKMLFSQKTVEVTFSKPQLLFKLVNKEESGKKIAAKLEILYNKYFKH